MKADRREIFILKESGEGQTVFSIKSSIFPWNFIVPQERWADSALCERTGKTYACDGLKAAYRKVLVVWFLPVVTKRYEQNHASAGEGDRSAACIISWKRGIESERHWNNLVMLLWRNECDNCSRSSSWYLEILHNLGSIWFDSCADVKRCISVVWLLYCINPIYEEGRTGHVFSIYCKCQGHI